VGEAQWRDAHVAVCGPAALVALVRAAARDAGAARVESEDFDIRSGVGPDRSREVEQLVTAVRRR
jgi:peptidyl-tRNA hydrolase